MSTYLHVPVTLRRHTITLAVALALAAALPAARAADTSTGQSTTPAATDAPPIAAMPMWSQMQRMQRDMAAIQATRDPAARRKLILKHINDMQGFMQMMNGMMVGQGMMGQGAMMGPMAGGPGMYGPGMYGQAMQGGRAAMMGPEQRGPGMYGPGMYGQAMYGPGMYGQGIQRSGAIPAPGYGARMRLMEQRLDAMQLMMDQMLRQQKAMVQDKP